MAGFSWSGFVKTVLMPMLIALGIYVGFFLVLFPLYRRYRSNIARYSNYAPLSSTLAQQTTSLFEPYLIVPSKTLIQKMKEATVRGIRWLIIPSSRAWETRIQREPGSHQRGHTFERELDEDSEDSDGGLFDVESGEAMVGFNIRREDDRRTGRDRTTTDLDEPDAVDSNRRLSRELEEGFRDDSGSEASEAEVTAGRRTVSRRGSEVWR